MGKYHRIEKWQPTTLGFPISPTGRGRPKRYISEKRAKVSALLIQTILDISDWACPSHPVPVVGATCWKIMAYQRVILG